MKSHVRTLTSKEDLIGIYKTMSRIKSVDRDLCIIFSDSTRNRGHQRKWAVPRVRTDKKNLLNLCHSLGCQMLTLAYEETGHWPVKELPNIFMRIQHRKFSELQKAGHWECVWLWVDNYMCVSLTLLLCFCLQLCPCWFSPQRQAAAHSWEQQKDEEYPNDYSDDKWKIKEEMEWERRMKWG